MSGAAPLSNVALRPWPKPSKEVLTKDEVLAQIEQLTRERGHLRDITERSLQDEIAAGKEAPEDVMEGVEQEQTDEQTTKSRLEEIHRVRTEMAQKANWAAFAAGNALDLVSLILSRDPTKNLENAYTPMFRSQQVPRGSLGLAKGTPLVDKQRLEDTARREELVMKGSRMEALDWATDSLLSAAIELETEIRKETKYWDEVLSISEKGWALERTAKGIRNAPFAVRYGFPEASNHFKARGLAPLRMDKDGGIILDSTLALKPKTMRIRISEHGKVTGTSYLPAQSDLSKLAIEQSIQLARDSLFEEELFHEMSIETRQLLAYGVELRDSVISITTPTPRGRSTHRKVLIDCISRDDVASAKTDHSQDWLAQNIAEALRLFLRHEHHMRLYRRSQIPPPMTQHKRQQPSPPLLRILLGLFSHLSAVDDLHAYLYAAAETLRSAGLDVNVEASRETSWVKLTDIVSESKKEGLPATDQLFTLFTRPFDSTASLSLPSSSRAQPETITIATRTYIGPPHFGAEHKLTVPPSLVKVLNLEHDQQPQLKFPSTEEVKSYLDWIISRDISHTLLFREYSGRSVVKYSEPRVSILSKGSKKETVKEDDVRIQMESGVLQVTATSNLHLATGATVEHFSWNGTHGQESLKEKVKGWVG